MFQRTLGAALATLLAASSAQAGTILNMIPPNPPGVDSGTIATDSSSGTAIYSRTAQQPTGTGFIDPFVRIEASSGQSQNQPTIRTGYNTDFRYPNNMNNVFDNGTQFDEKGDATYTHSLLFSSLQKVTIGTNEYYLFLLDANQTGTDPSISIQDIQIFLGSAPDLSDFDPNTSTFASGGTATLVYSLDTAANDNRVDLAVQNTNGFDANNGSGSGDMYLYVLASLFNNISGDYLYLYSELGGPPGEINNDGFEEWAALTGPNDTDQPVPEPSSVALALAGLVGLGAARWRRKAARS